MKIFISGIAGFLGSHIADKMISLGHKVSGCDNLIGGYLDNVPDNAVIKLGNGKRFEFKYDYCKGCGMCVEECPCGAIKMEPEEI